MNIKECVINFFKDHDEEILTGLSIAGLISSVVMAIKATPRAMKKMEDRKKELHVEKLSTWETVKTAGPCYIPTGIGMALTTVSIVAPVSKLMKSNSALVTGLMISEEARRSFEEKTKELVGEKKVEEIRDKIAEDKVKNIRSNEIIVTGPNKYPIVDDLTGDTFEYNLDELKRRMLDAKQVCVNFNFISVNEWRGMLGLKPLHAALGDLGWGPNTGFEIYCSYHGLEDGTPCAVIEYLTPPKPRELAM